MENITVEALFELRDDFIAPLFKGVKYPFEVLDHIGDFIKETGPGLPEELFEKIGENIWAARSAKIAPTASITGPCIIGENTEIRHCAFIRGSALIGNGCVVGNSTELKNAVLIGNVQVPHYNYVGDSVLGYGSHMGAGSITSNVKSDKSPVKIKHGGETLETGRKKLGAMLGDFVEIGCGSVLNPGTVIGKHTNVYPLSSVRGVIPPHSIYKSAGEVAKKHDEY